MNPAAPSEARRLAMELKAKDALTDYEAAKLVEAIAALEARVKELEDLGLIPRAIRAEQRVKDIGARAEKAEARLEEARRAWKILRLDAKDNPRIDDKVLEMDRALAKEE